MNALSVLAAITEADDTTLDPRVYVERKDRRPEDEEARQRQAVAFIRKHAHRVIVFAVPNAVRGAGAKLKQYREGAFYGAADLVCLWTGGVSACAGTTGLDWCKYSDARRATYTTAIRAADLWEASGRVVPYELAIGRLAAVTALQVLDARCPAKA